MKVMVGLVRGCAGDARERWASRWFCRVEAALVEEVAKRRLARKCRLAAERWLVAREEADGEPKLAEKRLLMAAQFLLAVLRRWRDGCVSGDGGERRLAAKRMLVAKLAS